MSTNRPNKAGELRKLAEGLTRKQTESSRYLTAKDVQRLVHELEVHQIELELQNEELRRAQLELEESRSKYFDLFDFAPIGYFTLGAKAVILEVNLRGADLLGVQRKYLKDSLFPGFVAPEDLGRFYSHYQKTLDTHARQTCDLRLVRNDGTVLYAQMESEAVSDDEDNFTQIRTTITDISKLKKAENTLQNAHDEMERRVEERTADLVAANVQLEREIAERRTVERSLKNLSSQLLDAHENESKRIGQELHDGLAQSLSAIKIWVEAALLHIKQEDGAEAAKAFESVRSLSQDALEEVRGIIRNLRPSILDDLGIVVAISSLGQDFAKTHPEVRVAQEITLEESHVPEFLKIVIYRIAQEALNNVAKHSQADLVQLALRSVDGKIRLAIHDNGVGFDMRKVASGADPAIGLGLGSMKERTEFSGGTFCMESHRGSGTRIEATWECSGDLDTLRRSGDFPQEIT